MLPSFPRAVGPLAHTLRHPPASKLVPVGKFSRGLWHWASAARKAPLASPLHVCPVTWRTLASAAWALPRTRPSRFSKDALKGWAQLGSRRSFTSSPFRCRGPGQHAPPNVAEPQSLSARFSKLSKEYGWTALGVYMALSVLDFPFCFLFVRMVGTDRVAAVEHFVTSSISSVLPQQVIDGWHHGASLVSAIYQKIRKQVRLESKPDTTVGRIEKAEDEIKAAGASLAAQLALAYAVHKSFIFIRLPLTAAVLPKVVKVLRSFGWNIGKRKHRP